MESLPFIDDHVVRIPRAREAVWVALQKTATRSFAIKLPRPLVALWGLRDTDPLMGFHVGASEPNRLLSLQGGHRFSTYELRFELEAAGEDTVVHAKTFAIFPGVLGRIYRALVIGTGGHRIVVRRMLRDVARRVSGAPPRA